MNTANRHTSLWLLESQFAPHVYALMRHFLNCRYASSTIDNYLAGLAHFAHWISLCNIDVKGIDETLVDLRIKKLLVLPVIAFCWAQRVGD